jgi:hypothetical protein
MYYLGLEGSFIAFGHFLFEDSSPEFDLNFFNQNLQCMDSLFLLQFKNQILQSIYAYRSDSLLQNNLKNKVDVLKLEIYQKAFIQQYNNRIIRNQLKVW